MIIEMIKNNTYRKDEAITHLKNRRQKVNPGPHHVQVARRHEKSFACEVVSTLSAELKAMPVRK